MAKATVKMKKKKKKIVLHKIPTKALNMVTPLYSHYTLLHVSACEPR